MAATLLGCACSSSPEPPERQEDRSFFVEKLKDPQSCKDCHQQHYEEWSVSMHAYASSDPVFLAMNRRGQEETNGALGNFCVKCHAPMAVEDGKTSDGLNLAELPQKYQGVTCYFCHNAVAVEDTHNNPIRLAKDDTMRGAFIDPVSNPVHGSEYSRFMSGSAPESAELCGSCHDIVLPSPPAPPPRKGTPVKLERTFSEWRESIFSFSGDGGPAGLACGGNCHMPPSTAPFKATGPAAEKGGLSVKSRPLHDHLFAGVDVALTRFPDTGDDDHDARLDAHLRGRIQYLLDNTIQVKSICVHTVDNQHSRVSVELENTGAGHSFPSGASHDRRAWVEVKAYLDGELVYSSGVVGDGEDVTQMADPDLWLFRDVLGGVGEKAPHMFWDITDSEPQLLPAPVTRDLSKPEFYQNHRSRYFPRSPSATIAAPPDRSRLRVTVLVRIQPMGYDVLDDLIGSGHLDPEFRARMPVFDLHPNLNAANKPALLSRFPELRRLSEVSFEWSQVVRASGAFDESINRRQGVIEDCVAMRSLR